METDLCIYLEYKNDYFILLSNLIETYPKIFKGCKSKIQFINKYEIPKNYYFYTRIDKDNTYIITDGKSYKYDKLYISESWFNDNFQDCDEINNDDVIMAPELIELNENQKFRGNDDNIIEIEVRGTRDFDNCYFKVKDISKGFDIENLHSIIIHKDKGYDENIHYKYFYFEKSGNGQKRKVKKLFLTYNGVLKVLFSSHKKTSDKFLNWASKILFTVHLGNEEEKQKLSNKLIGVETRYVKDVLKKSATSISCIYLFSLGYVKNLRESLEIVDEYPDDSIVFKYGMTCDLSRRTREHEKSYGKIKNVKLELVYYSIIDNEYISEAEKKLNNNFRLMKNKLDYENQDELVILSNKEISRVKKQYDTINSLYCIKLSKVNELINGEKMKVNNIKKDMKYQKLKYVSEIELLKKEIRIKELEYENLLNIK